MNIFLEKIITILTQRETEVLNIPTTIKKPNQ